MARKSATPDAPPPSKGKWTRATLPRVVLIMGAESALREDAIAQVRAAAFGSDDPGMNWMVMHGPSSSNESDPLAVAAVLDEACTKSMFGGDDDMKVVLVRQADIFVSDNYDALERNFATIPTSSVIALEVANPGKIKTTRFYKTLEKEGAVVSCESLSGKFGDSPDLEIEVEKRARGRGLELGKGALQALMERSTKNLSVIEEELDKLKLALHPGGDSTAPIAVSLEDIEECCASTRTYNAFNFADALIDRDTRRALEVLGAIFDRGIADSNKPGKIITQEGSIAMIILGALTYKLSQLQDLQAAISAGKSEYEAFGVAKVFGPRQESFKRTLKKHNARSLRKCMDALFRCNLNLRRGGTNAREVLERLVWDVVRA
jgi:DNA polymerase III delta subunit